MGVGQPVYGHAEGLWVNRDCWGLVRAKENTATAARIIKRRETLNVGV